MQQKHQDLLDEAQAFFGITIVAIAKQIAKDTGETRGKFACPRCGHGTVHWSVAQSNGHARVCCSTKYTTGGQEFSCTAAME